jgi:hypothetical protein
VRVVQAEGVYAAVDNELGRGATDSRCKVGTLAVPRIKDSYTVLLVGVEDPVLPEPLGQLVTGPDLEARAQGLLVIPDREVVEIQQPELDIVDRPCCRLGGGRRGGIYLSEAAIFMGIAAGRRVALYREAAVLYNR